MARAAGVRSFALPTGACSAEELRAAGADWVGPDLGALLACLLDGRIPKTCLTPTDRSSHALEAQGRSRALIFQPADAEPATGKLSLC